MTNYASDVDGAKALVEKYETLRKEIGKVIVGQHDIIHDTILSIFCQGHVLLVGVPGLAKTLLVNTIGKALGLSFSRIQFTPDLMPSDIVGSEILDETRQFKFIKGPVFANIVLADEINRTPPKTQAALLEAMQEKCITVSGKTYKLQEPFFVLATQNPIEQEGTYPLPEAQLDRFMFNLMLDYPSYEEEIDIVKSTTVGNVTEVNAVLSPEEILYFQQLVRRSPCLSIPHHRCKGQRPADGQVFARHRRCAACGHPDSAPPHHPQLHGRGRRRFHRTDYRRAEIKVKTGP